MKAHAHSPSRMVCVWTSSESSLLSLPRFEIALIRLGELSKLFN